MSCDGQNCGCGGKPDEKSEDTPVTQYIKAASKGGSPAPMPRSGFVGRAMGWFRHTVLADMRITRIRVVAQAFFLPIIRSHSVDIQPCRCAPCVRSSSSTAFC